MTRNVSTAVRAFKATFKTLGSARRAAGEKKYLKSDLRFLGVTLPNIRRTVETYCARHVDMSRDELLNLVEALWQTNYHELRSAGIGLLERKRALLNAKDMSVVEGLVRRSETWAYVDWLAIKIGGDLVLRYPGAKRTLRRWSRDPYMWIRRTSMLALLPSLKEDGSDFPLFRQFASSMIEEKEFFIRKAIGWILREVGKRRPRETYGFLAEHIDTVSGLTLREGSKYLPEKMRATLLKRYRSRPG